MFVTARRSGTYEHLEGGMGPGRQSRKFPWKKMAIGCGVLMGLVWFFGPRGNVLSAKLPTPGLEDVYPPQEQTAMETETEVGASPIPTTSPSPDADSDPLKTVHCTAPYAPHLPLVQYALMIDAGSTGSRIHIYKFNHCGPRPAYEHEAFHMTQPGLSDRAHRTPEGAAASLDVLLEEAVRVVPAPLHACTPLAVRATAGLRLLGAGESERILGAVERRLRERYPFAVPDEGGVAIMDGREEGVYAWITANYLLGALGGDAPGDAPTYAVLDLGGGSTQIVFQPEKGGEAGSVDAVLEDGEHRYELTFGGEEKVLYQHSYLGYGLKSARGSVHRVVEFVDGLRTERVSGEDGLPRVPNPCLAQGTSKEVEVLIGEGKGKVKVLMAGEDVGSFEGCNRVVELVMAKDSVCAVKPCSFDGVYQPSLLDAFPTGKILLLSYFYDRIMPLIPPPPHGGQPRVAVSTIATLARQVCAGPKSWLDRWGDRPEVMEELEDRPEWCLDLTFMHALLGLGYEFEDGREVELGKRIEGTELGWCLGATIAMVESGEVRCRAL